MGLFSRLFGRRSEPVTMLEEAIERLQMGIMTDLIVDYTTRLKLQPPEDVVLLANCVLTYATARNPLWEQARQYEKTHTDLVCKEALRLVAVPEVAKALSYLYAAIILLLRVRTTNPELVLELSTPLCARATELSLYIPNTYDICGSSDVVKCIQAISDFAVSYQRSVTGRK